MDGNYPYKFTQKILHYQCVYLRLSHEAAKGAHIHANGFDSHQTCLNQHRARTHHRVQHGFTWLEPHNVYEALDHLRMKLAPIWEKAMGSIAGSELIFLEKGLKPGRGVPRQFQGLAGTHEEVASVSVPYTGKVSSVSYEFLIRKEPVLVEGELQFINVIQMGDKLAFGRK